MNEIYSVFIDKKCNTPIYQQLGDALCRLIEDGALAPNTKLPPIRVMAKKLKINNVTVIAAYKYLENKKVVYSHVGSGTFVSPIPLQSIPTPVVKENLTAYGAAGDSFGEISVNFTQTTPPESLFPLEDFKSAFNELLDQEKGGAFGYVESQGYLPLRESICSYLLAYGVHASPDQIQIISGAQQGIDIVAKAMTSYGDVIFTEKPTFYGAAGAFLSRGGQIIEIPMEPDGMNISALEDLAKLYHPKFIYMMSYFQTPTGFSYSTEKKRRLLELADQYDIYIIEDDNLYDFHYSSGDIVPLKALDYKNRVIYIKSFSKILMPGLRLGFAVLPKKIRKSILEAKYITDLSTSGFIQKAFDRYLRKNLWEEHIQTLRSFGKRRYQAALKAADRYFAGSIPVPRQNGGVSPVSYTHLDVYKRQSCT